MPQLPPIEPLWKKLASQQGEHALEVLGDLPADAPMAYRTLHGLSLYDTERYGEAVEALEGILKDSPENPVAQLFLILSLFNAGRDQEAGRRLLHETVVLPHDHFLREFIRIFWPIRLSGAMDKVIAPPDDSQFKDPFAKDFAKWQQIPEEVRSELTSGPHRGSGLSDAGDVLAKSVGAHGKQALFIRRLGERYEKKAEAAYIKEDLQQAYLLMKRAYQVDPSNALSLSLLAFMKLVLFQREEARQLMENELRSRYEMDEDGGFGKNLPPQELVISYAWALHENGHHHDALRLLSTAHPEGPEDLGVHFYASVCWLMIGNEENFRKAFSIATSEFFIDTWEQLLLPFIHQTGKWLEQGGRQQASGTPEE